MLSPESVIQYCNPKTPQNLSHFLLLRFRSLAERSLRKDPIFKLLIGVSTVSHSVRGLALSPISYLTGHPLILGVEHADEWLLIVTLGVSIVTFASGHANVMQGCVHLILFAAYILLMFQG